MTSRLATPSVRSVCVCRSPLRSFSRTSRGIAPDRCFDLPVVLAHGRGHPGQSEPRVDLLLGPRDDERPTHLPCPLLYVEEPVLGQPELLAHRDLAHRHVVRGRTGEVLQRRAPGVERDHPQVDLEPGAIRTDVLVGPPAITLA